MRVFKLSTLAAAVALAGCVDVDLTTTITGADSARVSGYMEVQRQMLDMMGGGEAFCDAADGGVLTLTDTTARCDLSAEGTFAEVFQGDEPKPTATDQGDGTVLVSFPIGAMTADSAEMRNDPQAAAMMRPMLEGHTFTLRVAGAQIVSSNGVIAEDGLSASFTMPLVEILNPEFNPPATFDTVVRY